MDAASERLFLVAWLFDRYLRQDEGGREFDAICSAHPALAEELKALKRGWDSLDRLARQRSLFQAAEPRDAPSPGSGRGDATGK